MARLTLRDLGLSYLLLLIMLFVALVLNLFLPKNQFTELGIAVHKLTVIEFLVMGIIMFLGLVAWTKLIKDRSQQQLYARYR